MEIKYRKATIEDAYGYEYVAAHSWKDTYWDLLPHEYLENRILRLSNEEELEIKINSIKEYLRNNTGKVFVATDNDKVIGILSIDENEGKYKEYGHLEAIYLLPEYKGNKIGKELLMMAMKELIKLGYNNMQLECMVGNKTIDFYLKYGGYEIEKTTRNIYGQNVNVSIVLFDNLKEILEKMTSFKKNK